VSIGSDKLQKLTRRAPRSAMRNEVRKGSPKPIQFPDNESVARTEGSREGIALQSEVLVKGRDTRVAD
jgi:hypothetical protein